MAFPTTSVLDDFARADENPLSTAGSWSNGWINAGGTAQRLISEQVSAAAGGVEASSYWDAAQFTNAEAFVTITDKPANGEWVGLGNRITNPGTSVTCYKLYFIAGAGTDTWEIRKVIAGAQTTIANGTREFAAGEKMGLEANGTTISAYVFSGGSWAQLGTVENGDVTGAGYVGMLNVGVFSSTLIDDFGGGEIVAAAAGGLNMSLLWVG